MKFYWVKTNTNYKECVYLIKLFGVYYRCIFCYILISCDNNNNDNNENNNNDDDDSDNDKRICDIKVDDLF